MITDQVEELAGEFFQAKSSSEEWDWDGLNERLLSLFGFGEARQEAETRQGLDRETFVEKLRTALFTAYEEQEKKIGPETMRYLERILLLQMVDNHWKEHLLNMDHLKEGIGLRGYGQKNPLIEYKKEGFEMFTAMVDAVKQQTLGALFRVQLTREEEVEELAREQRRQQQAEMRLNRGGDEEAQQPMKRDGDKVGRNAFCPCGSGKKYKRCCGKAK